MWARLYVRAAAAVAVVALTCACGSGALDYDDYDDDARALSGTLAPTASASTAEPVQQPREEDEEEEEEEYGWGLPTGPRTPDDTFEDDVYEPLAAADCTSAEAALDLLWEVLDAPRTVLLYQAAVEACRGEQRSAREWTALAGEYGWAGLDHVFSGDFRYDCEVFRSVVSLLDRRPREGVPCPGGARPKWPSPDDLTPRDDPRTAEDESAASEPPLDDAPTDPPEASPSDPADATPSDGATDPPAPITDPSAPT